MRRFLMFFLVFFIIGSGSSLFATTHIYYWVNGSLSNSLTQGDMFAWEIDVAEPGNTVTIDLYLDLDGSHSISAGDLLLDSFEMQDGETGEDGPADSSATPDGIIYVNFGPFGFAPGDYVMRATDEDASYAASYFVITEMSSPPATISGNVYLEGVAAPDSRYENIMIGAMGGAGTFSGITDQNGFYTINLPVADTEWDVGIIFETEIPGFITPDTFYHFTAPAGNTGSIDFTYIQPDAWVYGDLLDEYGTLINIDTYIGLSNQTNGQETWQSLENGHFNLPAPIEIIENDSTNYFYLYLDNEALIPDYLVPQSNEPFPLSVGDSLERDITVYTADTLIYGYVTENGGNPSQSYQFYAGSDAYGYTQTMSDPSSGYFELSIKNGSEYSVGLQDDPEWGTPIPPGYVLSGGNWRTVQPGDTVYFELIQTGSMLAGTLSLDPGDPILDYEHNYVNAWDTLTYANYNVRVYESPYFELPVPDGVYNVSFNPEGNDYLVMPQTYNNIAVSQDTVDTLNYLLNYAHAEVVVKLVNAPIPAWLEWYSAQTVGMHPYIYTASAQLQPDSTFHLRVCEGEWNLNVPFFDPNYDVTPLDTVLTVTESDSSYYVEFVYSSVSDIQAKDIIPTKYAIDQNYPNPFNPRTTIRYQLPSASQVELTVFNLLGQKVTTLVSEKQKAGNYKVQWNASSFPSGVYFYRIQAGDFVQTKRMLLIK